MCFKILRIGRDRRAESPCGLEGHVSRQKVKPLLGEQFGGMFVGFCHSYN